MVENRDTGPDVERPAERPKIRPPGVVARNRRMVGDSLRYRVFLEARQGLEAKSAFFQPDGREAEAVFFEATGSRSYRDVIRGQGYERYTRTYTEDLGGGRYETRIIPFGERRKDFAYKFSFTSSAMRILLRNYLQKAHGHFSDEFFAEAEKVLQECMKAQAAGTRKIELMIPLAQIKVLQSCPEFREDPRFQAFLEKTKELEVKLEETRRQAFFRFETRPWAGMAKDGMGYSGAEGDIEYDKYDLRKVRARLTETLEAYLEATDDCLSEKFLAEALALAEQYGETEPPSMSPAGETMNEYQQYQAALRNAEIVRACCQLGEILSCSRLLDNPQYFPVIRALCKLPSGVPHPWGLISYYPRTDAMPGVSMEHLHVFQSLIEDDELWEAKNPHARNYLGTRLEQANQIA